MSHPGSLTHSFLSRFDRRRRRHMFLTRTFNFVFLLPYCFHEIGRTRTRKMISTLDGGFSFMFMEHGVMQLNLKFVVSGLSQGFRSR